MSRDDRTHLIARSAKTVQDTVRSSGSAAAASYTLIGSVVVLGAIGYGIDKWRGTEPWFLLSGLLLGMAAGFYELIKSVRRR